MNSVTRFSSHSEETIENFSNDTLNQLISLENTSELSEMLNSDSGNDIIRAMSNFLGASIRDIHSAKFYDSLNIFEKHGFIRESKKKAYEVTNSIITTTATAAVPILLESISYAEKKYQTNNFVEFFLGWIGYINHSDSTPQLRRQATKILQARSINPDKVKIDKIIGEYSTKNSSQLPHLSSKNLTALNSEENDIMSLFAKEIIAPCDLSVAATKDRALEFLEECFGISHSQAEKKINDILTVQEYHVNLTGFSTACFMTEFIKFAGCLSEAYKFGKYNAGMDICAEKISKNQRVLSEYIRIGEEAIIKGDPSVLLKKLYIPIEGRRDLLDTSSRLMQKVFSDGDVKKQGEILHATVQMAKKTGIWKRKQD